MYTTLTCSSCLRAKQLLLRKGHPPEEIDVSFDRGPMIQRTGNFTVPQIVIDGQVIGGFDKLIVLNRTGELDRLLGTDTERSA